MRSERSLIRTAKRYPKKTARDPHIDWNSAKRTSINTLKRILRKYGLYGRIATRKPLLNERHVCNRINWRKSYAKVRTSFWNDVTFSDESRLELFSRKREYVRRPKGLRFEDRYTTKTVKFGGQSLMVWGAIKRTAADFS